MVPPPRIREGGQISHFPLGAPLPDMRPKWQLGVPKALKNVLFAYMMSFQRYGTMTLNLPL